MLNPHSAQERFDAIMAAAIAAVSEHFSHLAVCDIIEPPHEWFDAMLARQVALHIVISFFDIPKRRVVEMQGRSREAINRGLRAIDRRCQDPVFKLQYDKMTDRAQALLTEQLAEAA
jgi:hypothetical protein